MAPLMGEDDQAKAGYGSSLSDPWQPTPRRQASVAAFFFE